MSVPPAQIPTVPWATESLRATVFPSPDAAIQPENWWQALLAQEPEQRIVRPRVGERKESGPFGSGLLTLMVRPERIDWRLSANLPTDEIPDAFPSLGEYGPTSTALADLVRSWIPLSPKADRIAFGAVALLPVASRIEGYEQLVTRLPAVNLDPNGMSDFQYRINRPRPSTTIPELRINRLATWSVAALHIKLVLGAETGGRDVAHAARLELDINTSPAFLGTFDPAQSAAVFGELVGLAQEILERGDVP